MFLARDPDEAFQSVYKRYVRGVAQVSEGRHLTPEVERSLLRDRFVRALKHLGNFDTDRVRVGTAVQGEKAHHWLDIAIVGHGIPTAFAHAIPLQATDDRLAFMHRGLVLEAAGDMPRQVPKLALYDDPPGQPSRTLRRDADALGRSQRRDGQPRKPGSRSRQIRCCPLASGELIESGKS